MVTPNHHSVPPFTKHLLILVLATAFIPFFSLFTSNNQALFFRDISRLYLPQKKIWREEVLQTHSIPLWNPYIAGGLPSLAEPSTSSLYPGNIILLLGSEKNFPWWFSFFISLHYFILAIGCFVFFKMLGLTARSANLWALTFTWSGPILSLHCAPHSLIAFAFIPWALISGMKIRTSTYPGIFVFLLSAFLALSFLNGDPLQILFLVPLIFLCCLLPLKHIPAANTARTALYLIASLGLFLLLVLPQLVATMEFLPLSVRNIIHKNEGAPAIWSLHPLRFIEFFWPQYWGSIRYWYSPEILRMTGISSTHGFFISDLHCGFFPIVILLSLAWRRKLLFEQKILLLACAFLFWIALGSFAWPFWVERIPESWPIVSGFRFSERLFPLVLFLMFWAVSYSTELFESNPWIFRLGLFFLLLQGIVFSRNTLVFSPTEVTQTSVAVKKIREHQEKIGVTPRMAGKFYGHDSEIIKVGLNTEYSKKMDLAWESLAINQIAYFEIKQSAGYMSIYPKNYLWLVNNIKLKDPKRWADLTGTKYLLSREGEEAKVWLNESEIPILSFYSNPQFAENAEALERGLSAPSFDPKKNIFASEKNLPPTTGALESFALNRSSTEEVDLTINSKTSGPQYLLFNETFYPKWKALVNDMPTKILEANGWAMLIPIETKPGKNTVRIYFDRSSFYWSLLGPLAWLLGFVFLLCFRSMFNREQIQN